MTTLTQHWDGKAWTNIPSPNPGGGRLHQAYFNSVAAVGTGDVWAVGAYTADRARLVFTAHWNGARWTHVPSPNPPGNDATLNGVSVLSSDDIWAAGEYDPPGPDGEATLTEHWDGEQWSIVPSPRPRGFNRGFEAVSAYADDDVWAVGFSGLGTSVTNTLVSHWDGQHWSRIPSDSPGPYTNDLYSVSAVGPRDAWVVGSYDSFPYNSIELIEHATGGSATRVKTPPGHGVYLLSVDGSSPSNVWAVGESSGSRSYKPRALHYGGQNWVATKSAAPRLGSILYGVAAGGRGATWAVGSYTYGRGFEGPLHEMWNGRGWVVR